MRDAVDAGAEFAVRPGVTGGRTEDRAVRGCLREEFGGAVETLEVAQFGEVEAELGHWSGGGRWSRAKVSRSRGSRGSRGFLGSKVVRPLVVVGSHQERIVFVTAVNGPRYPDLAVL